MDNFKAAFLIANVVMIGFGIYDGLIYILKIPVKVLAWFGGLPPVQWLGNLLTTLLLTAPFHFIGIVNNVSKLTWIQQINTLACIVGVGAAVFLFTTGSSFFAIQVQLNLIMSVLNGFIVYLNVENAIKFK